MWKLTIEQGRKSEYSDHLVTERVTLTSNKLPEITFLVERMSECEVANGTTYIIEKVGEES